MSDQAKAPADADDETVAEVAEPEQPTMYSVLATESRDQLVLHPTIDEYVATVEALRLDGFVSVMDLCGVDYLTNGTRVLPDGITPERFEVVVNLVSYQPPRRVRLRLQVSADDPTVPTLFDVFPGTENLERECYDMFGITFEGHPDPTRILMPADWDGHPLRKDFAVGSVPVQFKGAPAAR